MGLRDSLKVEKWQDWKDSEIKQVLQNIVHIFVQKIKNDYNDDL